MYDVMTSETARWFVVYGLLCYAGYCCGQLLRWWLIEPKWKREAREFAAQIPVGRWA
jgi:hypothetical protein